MKKKLIEILTNSIIEGTKEFEKLINERWLCLHNV
jgi:hypothetical protein